MLSPAKDTQAAAIEASGWGGQFRFLQPRNLAFWVYLVGAVLGTVHSVQGYRSGYGSADVVGHPALFAGIGLFTIYLLPWCLYLIRQNRFTALPAKLLLAAFVWGATGATFILAEDALLRIAVKLYGPLWAVKWGWGLAAGFCEEIAKGLGLLLLVWMAPRLLRGAYHGLIVGAFVGLGFMFCEDVEYAYLGAQDAAGGSQMQGVLHVFLIRGITGLAGHVLWSAIFCAGLMWVLGRTRGERRILGGLLAMFLAMSFHVAWDDTLALVAGHHVYYYPFHLGLGIVGVVIVVIVRRLASRQERVWIRDVLAPEYAAGVVDAPLLAAFSGLRKDRRQFRKLLRSRRQARHLVTAARDLAREIAHAHGEETNPVTSARREVLRLRSRYLRSRPPAPVLPDNGLQDHREGDFVAPLS